jgi:hypothetical protein
MDKNEVGQGYAGLGKQELNKRIKQHTALRDKAFAGYGRGMKEYKQAMKLVGEFGSDPSKSKQVGEVQKSGIDAGVKALGELQKASKLNKQLLKLKKNK